MNVEAANDFPKTGHLKFLVKSYKPEVSKIFLKDLASGQISLLFEQFFYFEVLDCVRRLLLASAIGVVSQNSAVSPVLGLIISLGYTYVFVELKPFKKLEDSFLGIVLAYSLVLFFFAALMVKVNVSFDPSTDQRMFGIALIFVMISGPLSILIQLSLAHIPVELRSKLKSCLFKGTCECSARRQSITSSPGDIEFALAGTGEADFADIFAQSAGTKRTENPILTVRSTPM